MRTKLICPECSRTTHGISDWFVETIRDDGLYKGKCPSGHKLLIATQTLRYEMLFEIALNAIADGYYREAVSSFAASLERYFEFAIRVICHKENIESSAFDKAWKAISSQSERQLGAYIFLYLNALGVMPETLEPKMVTFRNEVTHKGLLPDREKVLEFGCAVYELVQGGVRQLRDTHLESVNRVLAEHVAKRAEQLGDQYPRTFLVSPTVLNVVSNISSGFEPFENVIKARGII